jgi:hypothetical protein
MRKHKGGPSSPPAPTLREKFLSPRSPQLKIVIRPIEWIQIATPAGTRGQQAPGKSVEFINGSLITDDPEVIDFLKNKYRDNRFPVFCSSTLLGADNGNL